MGGCCCGLIHRTGRWPNGLRRSANPPTPSPAPSPAAASHPRATRPSPEPSWMSVTCRSPTAPRKPSTASACRSPGGDFWAAGPERSRQDEHAQRHRGPGQAADGTVLVDGIDVRTPSRRRPRPSWACSCRRRASSHSSRSSRSCGCTPASTASAVRREITDSLQSIGLEARGVQAVQASVGRAAAASLPLHRRRPRPGPAAARRADGRSRPSVAPSAVGADRAPPAAGREHPPDHPLDGGSRRRSVTASRSSTTARC